MPLVSNSQLAKRGPGGVVAGSVHCSQLPTIRIFGKYGTQIASYENPRFQELSRESRSRQSGTPVASLAAHAVHHLFNPLVDFSRLSKSQQLPQRFAF